MTLKKTQKLSILAYFKTFCVFTKKRATHLNLTERIKIDEIKQKKPKKLKLEPFG